MFEKSKYRKIGQLFDDVNSEYFEGRIKQPTFKLNRRMRNAGRVDLSAWQMDISISYHDKYGWDGELRNTIKHEMIHLYLKQIGKPTGHNKHFREMMGEIECTIHSKPNKRPYKYVFECPHCGKEYRTRKWIGKRYSCGKCSQGRFNKKHVLELKKNLCVRLETEKARASQNRV
jgi:predicted SprT family Zn-dependent metalloprotease